MSTTKNVPEIRFEKYKADWVNSDLGELIGIGSAARVHKEQWTTQGVPFYRTSDVVSIYKDQANTQAFISYELYEQLTNKIGKIQRGDLLITGGGSIGIPFLVKNDAPLYFKDADLLWLKNNNKMDGHFLYTFFASRPFRNYLKSISHIGTIGHYTISQAKTTPISYCDREEQSELGNYFQKLNTLINQHQQKHDKLSNLKKAMLEKMFPKAGETVPEIRFDGFFGNWKKATLGDLLSYERPDAYLVKSTNYSNDYKTPVLTANKGFLLGYTNEDSTCNKPSIIFDDFTLDCKYVDFPFMVKSSAIKILTVKDSDKDDLLFVFNLLNTTRIEVMGHARHYIGVVQNAAVTIPEKNEQEMISNYFRMIDDLINQHNQQITKLKNIKQACLDKMFV